MRYREAHFLSDKTLTALSDESGEVELWTLPANGVGAGKQLTNDAVVLRFEAQPSPDGKFIAHYDKNLRLFLYDVDKKTNRKIAETKSPDGFADLRWSPDSKWLAYDAAGENLFRRITVFHTADNSLTTLTTDRYDSYYPYWSPDGHWLYFLSDRNLKSVVDDPWGSYQSEPFFDKKTKIYQLALTPGLRSPWKPADETSPPEKPDRSDDVKIDVAGIQQRLIEAPIPPGNYNSLAVNDKSLFWLATPAGAKKSSLKGADIADKDVEIKNLTDDVQSFEMSNDGKKLLIEKEDSLYVIDATVAEAVDLAKKEVPLSNWTLTVNPREEWKQMFAEAWRLERDYFYDRNLHGVDWKEVRKKYEPLAARVAGRSELGDLLGQMVSELSALHIFVHGGDGQERRQFPAVVPGRSSRRDEKAGGYRVVHIYQTDPDNPEQTAPLAKPNVNVKQGDVITAINGASTLSVVNIEKLLRARPASRCY